MSKQTVEAQLSADVHNKEGKLIAKGGETYSAEYDFGDNLAEAVETYGEEVVFSRYKSAVVIDLQAFMRGLIRRGKSAPEVSEAVAAWTPGVKKVTGKSKEERARDLLKKLDKNTLRELLAELGVAA